jgi:hypothetical protein
LKAERIAWIAALVGGVGWCSKILIMLAQGGPVSDSIPENIAFFAGLFGVAIAGGAVGWLLTDRAGPLLRAGAVILGVITPLLVAGIIQAALGAALPDAGWFSEEVAFLVVGIAAILVGLRIALQPAPEARPA